MNKNTPQSKLIIISSPSGGGKDSVINALIKIFPESTRLITTTTRAKRPGNKEGVDYYFISEEEFKKKLDNNEFVEYNIYSGNYYGTQKEHLKQTLKNNKLVFTQMEINGKHNLDKQGITHLSIFLLPESLENLKIRIANRGGINKQQIEKRMEIAKKEIDQSADYDYRIVNKEGHLKETIAKIKEIINKELKT